MKKIISKKIFFTIFTAVTISGFIVICTLAQTVHHEKIQTKFTANEVLQPECIVREYDGKIGVFRGNGDKPYKIIDYDISLLSDYDRKELADGIIIESDEELRKFIEDIST